MKTFRSFALLILLAAVVAGCTSTPSPEPLPTQPTTLPPAELTAYPVPGSHAESETYPLLEAQQTPVPAYLVPGFITNTPDAALVSIIVSEVQHEEGVETIYIKNISSTSQDISNYMIYSPKLDVRMIFPSNLILQPDETFALYNGENLENYPEAQRWLAEPALTDTLDEVWLTNSAARIIYYFIYYPSITP